MYTWKFGSQRFYVRTIYKVLPALYKLYRVTTIKGKGLETRDTAQNENQLI